MPALERREGSLDGTVKHKGRHCRCVWAPGEVAFKSLKQSKPTGPAAAEGPLCYSLGDWTAIF